MLTIYNSKGLSKSVLAIGSSSVILERKKSGSDPEAGQFHYAMITDAQ
jgi:hypothetical protein